ncbi:DUF397 domain-containing protein [Actinomycetes bacterium KLBMP 9797]
MNGTGDARPPVGEWLRSTYCTENACVEVAFDGVVVRDSKNPDGPALRFTYSEWAAFLAGVRDGQFDLS